MMGFTRAIGFCYGNRTIDSNGRQKPMIHASDHRADYRRTAACTRWNPGTLIR